MDSQATKYDGLSPEARFANIVIDRLDGTSAAARLCDVQPPSVSEWRKTGIPKAQLKFLKLARPEVFTGLDEEGNTTSAEVAGTH